MQRKEVIYQLCLIMTFCCLISSITYYTAGIDSDVGVFLVLKNLIGDLYNKVGPSKEDENIW